jgi:AraC-like DNA-binding protein
MHTSKNEWITVWKVEKCFYSKNHVDPEHDHRDSYHIMYCIAGRIKIEHGGACYDLVKKQLAVFKPKEMHKFSVVSKEGAHTLDFKFRINDPELNTVMMAFPRRMDCKDEQIGIYMEKMVEEAINEKYYYRETIHALGLITLVRIIRSYRLEHKSLSKNDTVLPESIKQENFGAIIRYIQEHGNSTLTVDQLSRMAGYSREYFSRKFQAVTGLSPKEYIIKATIDKAKRLLRETDYSVGYISDLCGFNSCQYFSIFFKKYEKISPMQYRIQNKKNYNLELNTKG